MPTRTPRARKTTTAPEEESQPKTSGTEPEGEPRQAAGPDPELTEEEWAVARAELIASLPAEDKRPLNIYARLAQIYGYIHQIRKTGWNSFHKYKFVTESNVVEAVRPILSEYGIWLEHGLAFNPELGIVGLQRLTKTLKDKQKNIVGTSEDLTAVILESQFIWWNPTTKELERTEKKYWAGYGDDPGDKGVYKAETGAEKYLFMKTFLISTGDDPEADEGTDRRAAAQMAQGPVTVERGGRPGRRVPAAGGRQAENTTAQRAELKMLLVAAGLNKAEPIIDKLNEVLPAPIEVKDEDYAGALAAFLSNAPGTSFQLAIRKLKEETNGTNPETEEKDDAVAEEEPPVEAGALAGDDASPY
jgi:hypothetical protein